MGHRLPKARFVDLLNQNCSKELDFSAELRCAYWIGIFQTFPSRVCISENLLFHNADQRPNDALLGRLKFEVRHRAPRKVSVKCNL